MTGGLADSLLARIGMQRDLIQAMDQHCKSISVRVTSRCGSVSAEVDGLGAMTGLWLGDSAYHKGSEALAKLILDTAQAAAKAEAGLLTNTWVANSSPNRRISRGLMPVSR